MVIDDNPDFLALMAMLLENEDYRALMRSTGEGSIQQIKRQKPDLVILDLILPDADGFDIVRMLKDDPETQSIPAVVSTADLNRVEQEKPYLEAHSIKVLEKPYELDDLLQAIREAVD